MVQDPDGMLLEGQMPTACSTAQADTSPVADRLSSFFLCTLKAQIKTFPRLLHSSSATLFTSPPTTTDRFLLLVQDQSLLDKFQLRKKYYLEE